MKTITKHEPDAVTLVYTDDAGHDYEQPVADVVTAGTLIDQESGDDLPISTVVVITSDSWDNTVPRELASCLRDREDDKSVRAAEWLEDNENEDYLWNLIGDLLDRITELANEGAGE